MGSCNTTQNEQSGKDFLLKVCKTAVSDATIAIGTADDPNHILKAAHGLEVGDLIKFTTIPGSVSEITVNTLYFVKAVPSTGAFTISATFGGAEITFTNRVASGLVYEAFSTVGGLRTSGLAYASEGVETTNYGSNQWKTMKDGAGIRSASLSGEGVISNTPNFTIIRTQFIANALTCFALINVATGEIEYGCFKITSLEKSVEYSGEATYSLSAESSGEISYVAAV